MKKRLRALSWMNLLMFCFTFLFPIAPVFAASMTLDPSTVTEGYSQPVNVTATGSGTNFSSGNTMVRIFDNGTPQLVSSIVYSPTSVSFQFPTGYSTGTYEVRIETPIEGSGVETVSQNFTVVNPSVSISPNSVTEGYTSPVSITATGSYTSWANGVTSVKLYDGENEIQGAISDLTISGATSLTFEIPTGRTAGTYTLKITTGLEVVETSFTVRTAGISLTPSTIQAGYASPVTIYVYGTNTNFVNGSSVADIVYNGQTVSNAVIVGSENVTGSGNMSFQLATGLAAKNYTVRIQTGSELVSCPFTIYSTSLSVNPPSVPSTYGSAVTLTLTGTNTHFDNNSSVTLRNEGGTLPYMGSKTVNSGTSMNVQLNTGLGTGNYTLKVQSGTETAETSFSVFSSAVTINPAAAEVGYGSPITVTATGANTHFVNGQTSVTLHKSNQLVNNAITNVSVANSTSLTFDIATGQNEGTYTVKFTTGQEVAETQFMVSLANTPVRVNLTSAPQTINAGERTGAVRVQLQDAGGQPVNSTGDTTVNLNSANITGKFYDSPSGGLEISSVTISSGTSYTDFYYEDTKSGTVTITVSSTGLTGGNQTVTVNPGVPAKLALSVSSTNSVDSRLPVNLSLLDQFNNNTVASEVYTIDLSPTPGGTFYTALLGGGAVTQVNVGSGQGTASAYFETSTPGTYSLTAASTGLTSASSDTTFTSGVLDHFQLFQGPLTVNVNTNVTIKVYARDQYNNIATGYRGTVSFNSSDTFAVLPASYSFQASDNGVKTFTVKFLTPNKPGGETVTITDSAAGTSIISNVYTVTAPVTGLTLSKTNSVLIVGGQDSLSAVIAPSNATNKNVTWTSSDTGVVTVAGSGVNATITGVANGTATVRATSQEGGFLAECTVKVVPKVSSVSVPANSVYKIGDSMDFTVNFDNGVTVTGTDATLGLTIGSTAVQAVYQSKTANSMTFRYTIQSGEQDLDGITVGALTLNTTTIKDNNGNDALLTLNNIGTTAEVLVDASQPEVLTVNLPADGSYGVGSNIDLTVVFDEPVIVSGTNATLNLTVGSTTREAAFQTKTANSITFRYAVQAGEVDTNGISLGSINLNSDTIKDTVNNDAVLTLNNVGSTAGILVDGVVPAVQSVSAPGNGTYKPGDVMDFTVTFTENVTVTGTGSTLGLTVGSTGVQAVYQSKTANSVTFRYTVPSGVSDTDGISVGAITLNGTSITDAADNSANLTLNSVGSTTGVLVDGIIPAVTSVSVPSAGTYVAGQNLDFTVNFDDNVTVTGTDATLGLTIGSVSVQAAYQSKTANSITFRYTVQSGKQDNDGVSVGGITLNTTTIKDAAGNNANLALNNIGSTSGVLVDAVKPTVITTDPAGSATAVAVDKTITVTFNENILQGTNFNGITLKQGDTVVQIVYSINAATLTIDPAANLDNSKSYTVTIPAAAVKDSVENALAAQYVFSFTTVSASSPGGGGGGGTPVNPPAADVTVTKNVDPSKPTTVENAGGTVKLDVPAGAIEVNTGTNVNITITVIPKAEADNLIKNATPPEGFKAIGKAIEFKAEAVTEEGKTYIKSFGKPLKLTVELSADELSTISNPNKLGLFRVNDDGMMTFVGGKLVNGKLVVDMYGFSKYVVAEVNLTFNDMAGHWAGQDVELMASKYVVQGYPSGEFKPNGKVTRAEFAAMLVKAMNLPVESSAGNVTFKDVNNGIWYNDVVNTAVKAGLIKGYNDGTFRPNELVTREQMAVMLTNALIASGKSEAVTAEQVEAAIKDYSDTGSISDWAKAGLAQAVREGIVHGKTSSSLVPQDKATRAEAAVMISKFWEK